MAIRATGVRFMRVWVVVKERGCQVIDEGVKWRGGEDVGGD